MEVIDEGLLPGGEQNNDLNDLIAKGYNFDFGKYISDGFDIFKKDAGSFIGFGILSGLILALAGMIPFGGLIMAPSITIGYSIYSHKIVNDQSRQFSDFFKGGVLWTFSKKLRKLAFSSTLTLKVENKQKTLCIGNIT